MKSIKYFLFTLLIMTAFSCGRTDGIYKLTLLETSDVHGKYFDSLYNGTANRTSLANVSSYFNECDSLYGCSNVIKIDNGDFLQGDNAAYWANFVDTSSSRHLMVKLVDYLKYDALVLGNHDIETGHDVYDRIYSQLQIPYLAANIVKEGTDENYFKPYAILKKDGLKIAVIGYENSNIKSWLGKELWKGMDFKDIRKCAQSMVNSVNEKEKPDITILSCHAGVGSGEYDDFENPALYLARTLTGIDAVLCGHDHAPYSDKLENGTVIVDPGARCSHIARIDFEIEIKDGKVISKSSDCELIPMEGMPKDIQYVSTFKDDFRKVFDFSKQEIGTLDEDIIITDAFFGQCAYINLIQNAMLEASGAQISITAPLTSGGRLQRGKISFQDLFVIYPFENELYKIRLSGKQLKDYLEYSYMLWIGDGPVRGDHLLNIEVHDSPTDGQNAGRSTKYRFIHPSFNFDAAAGINYVVDITKPYGRRVNILGMQDGSEFSASDEYMVAISSYRASGGGKLLIDGAGIPKEELPDIVVEKYPDIRNIIYNMFLNSRIDLNAHSNWKFIPERLAGELTNSDKRLLFDE